MGFNIYKFLLLLVIFNIKYLECIPVTSVITSEYEFRDDWNYQISPHSVPLLNGTTKNHILPELKTVERVTKSVTTIPNATRLSKKLGDAVRSRVSCSICKLGVGLLSKEIAKGTSFEDLKEKFVSLCVTFKIEGEEVCSGVFDVYGGEVVTVMKQLVIGPPEICSLVLGESCGDIENPLHEWTIELPDIPKPEVSEPEIPKDGLPTFKVLHLSDTHYDPDYVIGSVSNCQEPLCCRTNSTPSETEEIIPAGKWGAYKKCDSPRSIIINMMENIVKEHPDIDYIIWTGDLPPHDIWNQTRQGNLDIIRDAVEQMFEMFPRTPIFPALGNHESIPPGSFPPPWVTSEDNSIAWLYTQIADHWRRWLPASVGNTVLHGGFYSVLIRPGFRLISLNMNYCHSLSWWLLLNSTDPAKELKWLVFELQEAENKGEKVHIIGHIPPGGADCMKVWSRNFYKIMNRYENTVKAQFYGHTHADEFEVFYDSPELSRATNVAYLGPSVTTFENHNPAYRIYYVDGEHATSTKEILDHETWTMNLGEANEKEGDPEWYRLYSAKNAYGMNSLRPSEWAKLIERMISDNDLFDLFYKHYFRDSPTRPPCDDYKCKLQLLCDLKSGKSHDRHHLCHDLELAFGS